LLTGQPLVIHPLDNEWSKSPYIPLYKGGLRGISALRLFVLLRRIRAGKLRANGIALYQPGHFKSAGLVEGE